jgi:hypothetical protein
MMIHIFFIHLAKDPGPCMCGRSYVRKNDFKMANLALGLPENTTKKL